MKSNFVILLLLSLLFNTTFEQQEQLSRFRAERAALLELRSSLGLRAKQWPIKLNHCENWMGIICQNGSVVEINISGFKRTRIGSKNPRFSINSLANLTGLISFNASGFTLPGSIPDVLGFQIQKVQVLDLRFCQITGAIPFSVGNLTDLVELYLSDNSLTGSLSGGLFSSLHKLETLVLNHNNFTGNLPDELWLLPVLSFLDASNNNFTGSLPNLDPDSNLTNFTSGVLNLSHNMFYGNLTPVLRRFSSVDLSYNYLQGKQPDYTREIVSLNRNCLQNTTSQRSVRECATFYASKGLSFDNFGLPNDTLAPPLDSHKVSKRWIILAAVLGGVGVVIVVVILVVVCCRKSGTTPQRGNGVGPAPAAMVPPAPAAALDLSNLGDTFTYQQIVSATGDFSEVNLIKHGHSGDIFRGVLEGGISVIIKRFDVGSGEKDGHVAELDLFSKVSHPRLVPLLGHCLENENGKFLVYKYMPNGDLSSSLYRKNDNDDDGLQSLDWITRLKIALGAAEALSYLHHECTPPLVHRDVQASSILLDDKYEVRLGSLSEVCFQEGDNHSNRFTRLLRFPQPSEQGASGAATATCAYDVYCFGKVLLELVTGKIGISSSNDPTQKESLEKILQYINIYDKELVTNIVDPSLIIDEDLLEEVWAMAVVARSCLNPKPTRRPLMRYILKALENPLKVVREESGSSAKLRTTSSRGSWNAALFSSWRQGSVDVAGPSSLKRSGTSGSHSGSGGQNGEGDHT